MARTVIDLHARRQLVLTRIAQERRELAADVADLHEAASLQGLMRSVLGRRRAQNLFGIARKPTNLEGWVRFLIVALRRYRLAATLLGTLLPLLGLSAERRARKAPPRRGGGVLRSLKRLAVAGALGGAAWVGWRASQSRRG